MEHVLKIYIPWDCMHFRNIKQPECCAGSSFSVVFPPRHVIVNVIVKFLSWVCLASCTMKLKIFFFFFSALVVSTALENIWEEQSVTNVVESGCFIILCSGKTMRKSPPDGCLCFISMNPSGIQTYLQWSGKVEKISLQEIWAPWKFGSICGAKW